MTSRDIAQKAIRFQSPERVPVDFGRLGRRDFHYVRAMSPNSPLGDGRERDEWGCVWHRPPPDSGIHNEGMIKEHPLANASLEELASYPFPDSRAPDRYRKIQQGLENPEAHNKFVWLEDHYTLFERCWALRGMEQLLVDMHENADFVHALLGRVADFHMGVLENLQPFRGQIHGYHIGDDWGSQNGPLISTALFREFFKPHYKDLFERAHSMDMAVRLHSDGKINELIEEFIDIGLDLIEINSPRTLGMDAVCERFRGRIAFEVCVDIQTTLPRGDGAQIRAEVRELIEKWGTEEGGLIALGYPDLEGIGASEESDRAALEAFLEYGRY